MRHSTPRDCYGSRPFGVGGSSSTLLLNSASSWTMLVRLDQASQATEFTGASALEEGGGSSVKESTLTTEGAFDTCTEPDETEATVTTCEERFEEETERECEEEECESSSPWLFLGLRIDLSGADGPADDEGATSSDGVALLSLGTRTQPRRAVDFFCGSFTLKTRPHSHCTVVTSSLRRA